MFLLLLSSGMFVLSASYPSSPSSCPPPLELGPAPKVLESGEGAAAVADERDGPAAIPANAGGDVSGELVAVGEEDFATGP